MLTINGLFEDYNVTIDNVTSNRDSIWVYIVDIKNTVGIKGHPVNFEYFVGETGKHEFRAVFSKYDVETL